MDYVYTVYIIIFLVIDMLIIIQMSGFGNLFNSSENTDTYIGEPVVFAEKPSKTTDTFSQEKVDPLSSFIAEMAIATMKEAEREQKRKERCGCNSFEEVWEPWKCNKPCNDDIFPWMRGR